MGGVEEVVHSCLSVGESAVADEAQQRGADALERDVTELAASPLSDRRIEQLFSMAASWNYCFRGDETARAFVERINITCRQWKEIYGRVPAEADAAWASQDVVAELRDMLATCARSASADLACRLLLRIRIANFVPVEFFARVRCERVASRLALGEEPLSSLEFLASAAGSTSN
ncbi:hypothetical protein [Streptoalloteichus tenebrarius]|uniref:hypothetical protein n=1 Tax=Streptoalloteichus tenebrarius (strain ATCC 17920 / DSM 40477 / JCM 4838 / CBS 697.72 / NBRC 16177 / NCIMB 11028 / NRRL B-12390 / A12253. 1 / ISP 5477) TaxID=1933 RepID=UPI0020A3A599|nr:hypothetical protein [Streptoalloteichus tenebrarius]BFF01208.1 hypothetical protein GCM10020241_28830 [Streptoalloteichus tenebrarius]